MKGYGYGVRAQSQADNVRFDGFDWLIEVHSPCHLEPEIIVHCCKQRAICKHVLPETLCPTASERKLSLCSPWRGKCVRGSRCASRSFLYDSPFVILPPSLCLLLQGRGKGKDKGRVRESAGARVRGRAMVRAIVVVIVMVRVHS